MWCIFSQYNQPLYALNACWPAQGGWRNPENTSHMWAKIQFPQAVPGKMPNPGKMFYRDREQYRDTVPYVKRLKTGVTKSRTAVKWLPGCPGTDSVAGSIPCDSAGKQRYLSGTPDTVQYRVLRPDTVRFQGVLRVPWVC